MIKEYSWIFGRRGRLARKRFTAEQIVIKLREAEVAQSQGKTVVQMCKPVGVTEQTDYRWRKEYGGLRMDQAKRLKSLDKENARLKKLVADLSLDNQILKEVSSGNFQARRSGEDPWYGSESGSGLSESVSVGPAACWDRPEPPSEESDRFPKEEAQLVLRMLELASQYSRVWTPP